MKASGLQSTWLIASGMRADVHKMGNDRWTRPPLINIRSQIMRLNSSRTRVQNRTCAACGAGDQGAMAFNEVQGQIFVQRTFRGKKKSNRPPRLLGASASKWIYFLSAHVREMWKEASQVFPRRCQRFNCRDMNAIFASAALKLNGQAAAVGAGALDPSVKNPLLPHKLYSFPLQIQFHFISPG